LPFFLWPFLTARAAPDVCGKAVWAVEFGVDRSGGPVRSSTQSSLTLLYHLATTVAYHTISYTTRITLQLQSTTSPYTVYQTKTKDVTAGSNKNTTINFTVPSTTPVGSAAYKYFVFISPMGGNYNNRFDEAQQANVTVQ
jgi:hypothetical protein